MHDFPEIVGDASVAVVNRPTCNIYLLIGEIWGIGLPRLHSLIRVHEQHCEHIQGRLCTNGDSV